MDEENKDYRYILLLKGNETRADFICEVIEIFEDFLDEKKIIVNNPEKKEAVRDGEDPESICNIYGTDYGILQSDLEALVTSWKIIKED